MDRSTPSRVESADTTPDTMTIPAHKRTRSLAWHMTVRCVLVVILGIVAAACTNSKPTEIRPAEGVPTRTLVPPTPTATLPPALVTPTPTDLPGPDALVPASSTSTPETLTAADMVDRTLEHLVAERSIDPGTVRLMSLDAFTWPDDSWGCDSPATEIDRTDSSAEGYRVVFNAGTRLFVYHTDTQGDFFLCNDREWLALEGDPVVSDPIAADLVQLSLTDAARRFEQDTAAFTLTSMISLTWPDASLGCPKPDADYDDRATPGYRVVFRTSDQQVIYHTSSQQAVYCTPEEEILPGILRRAIPATPEPEVDE